MSFTRNHYSACLLTDFYQLTMAYGYWKSGLAERESVFHMHFRRPPFNGGIAVAAGLQNVIEVMQDYRFLDEDLLFLKSMKNEREEPLFCDEFLKYLKLLKFEWNLDAIEEGEIVFPHEPLVRVSGPLLQCQLLESLLLNIINFQTLIATKAARLYIAANGTPIFEFGFRRAQGVDGAVSASRAAYIGGCVGTSNVMAGKLYNIPVKGTQAHSWILAFDKEIEAFEAFAATQPDNCLFLVDTYNSLKGIEHAIEVGKKIQKQGKKFLGIRLDSGDLAYLSIQGRKMLDQAGFNDALILASNELDETLIRDLIQQGAQISVWGVGTNLVTSKGQSALDGVYKMSALRSESGSWEYRLKLSEQMRKTTHPGILQVRRFTNGSHYVGDAIYNLNQKEPDSWTILDPLDPTKKKTFEKGLKSHDLLRPIFRKGECIYKSPQLSEIRDKMISQLPHFHSGLKRFLFPHQYPVGLEESLYQNKVSIIEKIRRDK